MPKLSEATKFDRMMDKMMRQRREHQEAVDRHQAKLGEIDEMFARHGIALGGGEKPAKRGPKPGAAGKAKRGGKRHRGSFPVTGTESVLKFIKQHGSPSTAELNKHWQKEGRKGKADNLLSLLAKAGKVKREKSGDVRGSRYKLA
ncbi:MAG: hypothetical protein WD042_04170 [Phycisphaeraceae bacterium]